MKNTFKVLGIIALAALIGFSFIACGDDDDNDAITVGSTSGRLTINNIPAEYNGKWIIGMPMTEDGGDAVGGLILAASINSQGTITGGQISGGSVTLNVWKIINENSIGNFNGSGTEEIALLVIDKASLSDSEFDADDDDWGDWMLDMGFGEVTFTNGVGTLSEVEWLSEMLDF
jgi:hypothetical protein